MAGTYLFDTNTIIGLLNKQVNLGELTQGGDIAYIPYVVLGELYFGAFKSKKKSENLKKIKFLENAFSILTVDMTTPRVYGEIKSQLLDKGRPIPDNDMWVAALAQQYHLTILTNDKHYEEIDNLDVKNW